MKYLLVDLFCGSGGTTTGFVKAKKKGVQFIKPIAGINHDHTSITNHWANYPEVRHFEESIQDLDLTELIHLVEDMRKKYPDALLILWASLECTHFSGARGSAPKNLDSRTLADHLPRYITALKPEYLMIENVREFSEWGPLDEKGKPIKTRKGEDFKRWNQDIVGLGYNPGMWEMLRSSDFGGYTTRNRLFGCFTLPGYSYQFPTPTHNKTGTGGKKKWKAVKEILDLQDEGKSLFSKTRSENTMIRLYKGLLKFGTNPFVCNHKSGNPAGKNKSLDEPIGVITTIPTQTVIQSFISTDYACPGEQTRARSVEEPANTLVTDPRQQIVQVQHLDVQYNNGFSIPIEGPASTLTTKDRLSLVTSDFLCQHNGVPSLRSVDEPANTVVTKPKTDIVKLQYLDQAFSQGKTSDSLENPVGALTTVNKNSLVTYWLMNTNFSNVGNSVEEPARVITANRKWQYLISTHWFNSSMRSVEDPAMTVIGRMDKSPIYLVTTTEGALAVPVFPTDSEYTIKIKEFMAQNKILDIKIRGLKIPELLRIQSFPPKYKLSGTQTAQKKGIGNSVEVTVARCIAEALP